MIPRPRDQRCEAGETLIEILVSVAIMGIVMVGLIAGLTTATVAGDAHRRLSDVEVVARAYGEAVVDQAAHPGMTQLTSAAATGATTLNVVSTAAFPLVTPDTESASIDGEVVVLHSKTANTLTLKNPLTDDHPIGAPATRYEPCPGPAFFQVAGFTHGAVRVGSPTVTIVDFLAPSTGGNPPMVVPSAACGSYWSTTGLPCSADEDTPSAPRPHYTVCDPPAVRLTIQVDSTDLTTGSRGATTTTQVLVNRGNS